ncbi:phosphomannomutase [Thiohalorhabdus denitrificans]|uniref:phosphomannomutase n=1 Tax=Thiohalorhabdus denitrificans TaxID=381306 RepID=A0A0P9GGA4_9GAMM|nr:phosphomannomutase/phosphoglucomutase [Thiohalorhabdus denitrificans]KPV39052.1 phosphomannomutase [Thiohalorhabdus denitrificans]SCX78904.1 phosphomannomutase / phosphoglucomutase [Thiohalorhabdus denitrificans]
MGEPITCFKAYDVRGRVPDDLNPGTAHRIGQAFAEELGARHVAVGRDVRLTSPELLEALAAGLEAGGAKAHDLGLCGTETVYFATFHYGLDGGVMVTASHNPMDYNGLKLVREEARPISGDSGLAAIQERANAIEAPATFSARPEPLDARADYVEHLLGYLDSPDRLRPLRIVTDPGNGGAGPVLDALAPHLPFELIRIHHEPDGRFPNGIPNPLLPENRDATAAAVREHGADLGVAWDGDYDRCFLFTEDGAFVEGYYLIGLLAQSFLRKQPGERIIHDPRLTWNTIETVKNGGGTPVQSKTGHAFMKESMRREDAVYGAEMSGHHFFRRFGYCDSGMIPWLLAAELMSQEGKSLSRLVGEQQAAYPCSGEINFEVRDPHAVMETVVGAYRGEDPEVDRTDGVSVEFAGWRFNLRPSNTEPLLRLNVETRADPDLLREKTEELGLLIRANA